jgi:hypothetical protein
MMNATLLCLAMLLPGYGEKDIAKAITDAGGRRGKGRRTQQHMG